MATWLLLNGDLICAHHVLHHATHVHGRPIISVSSSNGQFGLPIFQASPSSQFELDIRNISRRCATPRSKSYRRWGMNAPRHPLVMGNTLVSRQDRRTIAIAIATLQYAEMSNDAPCNPMTASRGKYWGMLLAILLAYNPLRT